MADYPHGDVEVLERKKVHTIFLPKWNVIFLNDDVTTFDFVIWALMTHYSKSSEEAADIALKIHKSGRGIAGRYNFEVAETKAAGTVSAARAHGFPLRVIIEEND